ncbi:hypothetical protein D3C72_2421650 [compost metagenome]
MKQGGEVIEAHEFDRGQAAYQVPVGHAEHQTEQQGKQGEDCQPDNLRSHKQPTRQFCPALAGPVGGAC